MRITVVVVLALTGCYRPGAEVSCTVQCNAAQPCEGAMNCERGLCRDPLAAACTDDAGTTDAPDPLVDASGIDAPIPVGCWGALPHRYCQMPAPTGTLDLIARKVINTDADPLCAPTTIYPYCVIAYQDIVIRESVEGYGSKPLMFVATNSLTITPTGTVDVSALGVWAGGPGAGCSAGVSGTVGATSSGGGAGGTFAGLGGSGGAASGAGSQPGAPATPIPATVRGGCGGSHGGGNTGGGVPGLGGGAVVLIAGGTLSVNGPILARGAAGAGGDLRAGGGGGGSGGMIVLDGMQVIVSSSLIAGGGGGGGGGSSEQAGGMGSVTSSTGSPGQGGPAGSSTTITPGDSPGRGGGGSGTLTTPLVGESGAPGGVNGGGGGGGGGAGVIWIRGTFTDQGATIVPPRT